MGPVWCKRSEFVLVTGVINPRLMALSILKIEHQMNDLNRVKMDTGHIISSHKAPIHLRLHTDFHQLSQSLFIQEGKRLYVQHQFS